MLPGVKVLGDGDDDSEAEAEMDAGRERREEPTQVTAVEKGYGDRFIPMSFIGLSISFFYVSIDRFPRRSIIEYFSCVHITA